MKIIKTIAMFFIGIMTMTAFATVTPSARIDNTPVVDLRKIKTKEIERLTGKKLNRFASPGCDARQKQINFTK